MYNKYDNIIILNPTLENLFNHDIYKLVVENETYYIPLWHHELCFNKKDKPSEIIIQCHPDLSNNIYIDQNNNIHYTLKKNVKDIIHKKSFKETLYKNHQIEIHTSSLKLTTDLQVIILKNQGIPKIDTENIYNVKEKMNIYIEMILF